MKTHRPYWPPMEAGDYCGEFKEKGGMSVAEEARDWAVAFPMIEMFKTQADGKKQLVSRGNILAEYTNLELNQVDAIWLMIQTNEELQQAWLHYAGALAKALFELGRANKKVKEEGGLPGTQEEFRAAMKQGEGMEVPLGKDK